MSLMIGPTTVLIDQPVVVWYSLRVRCMALEVAVTPDDPGLGIPVCAPEARQKRE